VKAYFRNVEDQIKDWEGVNSVGEEREGETHRTGRVGFSAASQS
jgi:nucleolar protein 9